MSNATRPFVLFCLITLLALCSPSTQAADPGPWTLRLTGSWVDPSASYAVQDPLGVFSAEGGGAAGVGVGVEYRLARRLGIELSAVHADLQVKTTINTATARITESPDLRFEPITLAFNLHLTPDAPLDLWVAPSLSYVRYGDFHVDAIDDLGLDWSRRGRGRHDRVRHRRRTGGPVRRPSMGSHRLGALPLVGQR